MPKKEMTIEEIAAVVNEQDRRIAEQDCAYFIEHFAHVEDKDGAELVIPFKLWDGQKKALDTLINNRLNIVLKARQLGLTWLVLSIAVWGMVYNNGYTVVALSKKEDPDAYELVRRVSFILKYMPKWWIKQKGEDGQSLLTWEKTATKVTIYRPNGEPSIFQSFAASEDSGRSFTASLVILDEWAFQQWAREIWTAAYPTINRPAGGKLIGLSTMQRGTLYEEKYRDSMEGRNNFARVFLPWNTDPRRDAKWYEDTKKEMGELIYVEYPASEEEAFMTPGGVFFNELNEQVHIKNPVEIPKYAQRYVSLDYGLDMTAALWYWVDSMGRARIYRELFQKDLIVSDAAKKIREMQTDEDGNEEHITTYLAPPDLIHNRRSDTGKTVADIFAEQGIYLTETSNNRVSGWKCVKELLNPIKEKDEQTGEEITTAKLTIDRGCAPNLWRSLLNIQHNKHNYDDVESKGDTAHELTHAPDSLRAFAVFWITPSGVPTDVRRAHWSDDMYEDYWNATEDERQFLLNRWGNPFV